MSQQYLDSLSQRLLSDDFLKVPEAKPASSGIVGTVVDFVKKYYIYIIIVVVLIVGIALFAQGKKVATFASISGNAEEDTANWEEVQYQLPASPYEPTEPIKV